MTPWKIDSAFSGAASLRRRLRLRSPASDCGNPSAASSTCAYSSKVASVEHLYSDSGNPRTLGVGINTVGPNTIESCTDACFNAGYPLAGAEFSTQCFCDLDFAAGSGPTPLADCDMPCAGNSSEFCGGPNRLNVSSGPEKTCEDAHRELRSITSRERFLTVQSPWAGVVVVLPSSL